MVSLTGNAAGRRSALAALGLLAGCVIPAGEQPREPAERRSSAWQALFTLAGARVAIADRGGMPLLHAPAPYVRLVSPVAVVTGGHDFYVADAGASRIYRYDPALDAMAVVGAVPARADTRLALAPDHTLLVVEPGARRVTRYARDGRLVATYADGLHLAQPVSAAWDEAGGRLIVADAVYRHLVAFHPAGRASSLVPMHADERNRVHSVGAVAVGKGEIHLADPVCRCIHAIARDGRIAYAYGHHLVVHPGALALDEAGRAYVADTGAAAVRVFEGVRERMRVDATQLGLVQISDLALYRSLLVVADATSARVAVFRLPPALQGRP